MKNAYKVMQLELMLAHEVSPKEEHYGAHLQHWYGDSKPIQIDAGGLRALIDHYGDLSADETTENLLALMKAEAVRSIRADVSMGSKVAWYWSHVGALDMARQLGFISEERRQELYEEFRQYNPLMEGQEE